MRKTLIALVLVAVMAFCGFNLFAASQVKVTVMYNSNEFTADDVAKFEAENPDIKIVMLETDAARFMAMNAAGNPPDIMRCNAAWIPYLVTHKMVLDITPYLKTAKYLKDPKDFHQIIDTYKYKGKLYGFVKDWSPTLIGFYNKTAFDEVGLKYPSPTEPMTYQEMGDIARKLQKTEGDRVIRRGLAFWPGDINAQLELTLIACGGELYNKEGTKINLTSNPRIKEICQFFFDLAKDKIISSPVSPAETWEGSMFQSERVGIMIYGYWYGAMCEGDQNKGKVGIMAAPTWDKKLKRISPSHNVTGGFISSKTKNPKETFRVFDWFFGGEPAQVRATTGWGVPALNSLVPSMPSKDALGKERQLNVETEMKYLKVSRSSPYILPDVYENSMRKNFELALKGEIDLDKFLKNVETEVNKAIDTNRAALK